MTLSEDNLPHYFGTVEIDENGGGRINVRKALRDIKEKPLSKEGMEELLTAANGRRKHRRKHLTKDKQAVTFAVIVEGER